jgi:hypothetical protein
MVARFPACLGADADPASSQPEFVAMRHRRNLKS